MIQYGTQAGISYANYLSAYLHVLTVHFISCDVLIFFLFALAKPKRQSLIFPVEPCCPRVLLTSFVLLYRSIYMFLLMVLPLANAPPFFEWQLASFIALY